MLHLNFQGDRLEAPIFLFGMTSVGGFLFILGRYTDLQPLMILQHFQNQRYQRYHRRRFFLDWGWWEKHRIEIRNGGFFRFRRLTKSCVQLVTRMHIHSNMFKHHHWIMISSTYPRYFGHMPYHLSCDFIWQWLNNQKHQKANVHQNVQQFHFISICFSLTQKPNVAMVLPSESLESPWSEPELSTFHF